MSGTFQFYRHNFPLRAKVRQYFIRLVLVSDTYIIAVMTSVHITSGV